MTIANREAQGADRPAFVDLFTPKLFTTLREGYSAANFRADIVAGLTVAIVALPLSMAIAIASGTTPDRGLVTAIVGGFLVSALGGSRFQIGGPAGAFIVLVAATIMRHGIDGLVLATFLAGLMLIAAGFLRIGTYIKFIPFPVTVGFTAGISVIILASQLRDLFGLTLTGPEPGEFIAKLKVLADAMPTVNASAAVMAAATIALIAAMRRVRPAIPAMLIAIVLASLASWMLTLPVETIGTRFGGIPQSLPWPALPAMSLAKIQAVLPDAVSLALLGAIESLLSAVVADGMTGRRHRSNCELVAQGVANVGASLFGGICVTGTIARTATNVRSGAHGPVSGILHSAFLLLFVLVAAPLASFIPLASLAGVLVVVAWNMAEKHEFVTLLRSSPGDAAVLLATFLLTVFRDLTEGIVVGFALGAILFIDRMSRSTGVQAHAPLAGRDQPDDASAGCDAGLFADPDVVVYRITGAFFFGAASAVGLVLDRVADQNKAFVIDFAEVPFLDSTAANAIGRIALRAGKKGVRVYLTGTSRDVRESLFAHGARPPHVVYRSTIESAVAQIKRGSANLGGSSSPVLQCE